MWKQFSYLYIKSSVSTQFGSSRSVPVCRLGGDQRAQRRERRVNRIGAISLPRIGGGPLADLPRVVGAWRGQPAQHAGTYSYPSASSYPATQLPLPVHLDVKSRRGRGGQTEGGRVVGPLVGT